MSDSNDEFPIRRRTLKDSMESIFRKMDQEIITPDSKKPPPRKIDPEKLAQKLSSFAYPICQCKPGGEVHPFDHIENSLLIYKKRLSRNKHDTTPPPSSSTDMMTTDEEEYKSTSFLDQERKEQTCLSPRNESFLVNPDQEKILADFYKTLEETIIPLAMQARMEVTRTKASSKINITPDTQLSKQCFTTCEMVNVIILSKILANADNKEMVEMLKSASVVTPSERIQKIALLPVGEELIKTSINEAIKIEINTKLNKLKIADENKIELNSEIIEMNSQKLRRTILQLPITADDKVHLMSSVVKYENEIEKLSMEYAKFFIEYDRDFLEIFKAYSKYSRKEQVKRLLNPDINKNLARLCVERALEYKLYKLYESLSWPTEYKLGATKYISAMDQDGYFEFLAGKAMSEEELLDMKVFYDQVTPCSIELQIYLLYANMYKTVGDVMKRVDKLFRRNDMQTEKEINERIRVLKISEKEKEPLKRQLLEVRSEEFYGRVHQLDLLPEEKASFSHLINFRRKQLAIARKETEIFPRDAIPVYDIEGMQMRLQYQLKFIDMEPDEREQLNKDLIEDASEIAIEKVHKLNTTAKQKRAIMDIVKNVRAKIAGEDTVDHDERFAQKLDKYNQKVLKNEIDLLRLEVDELDIPEDTKSDFVTYLIRAKSKEVSDILHTLEIEEIKMKKLKDTVKLVRYGEADSADEDQNVAKNNDSGLFKVSVDEMKCKMLGKGRISYKDSVSRINGAEESVFSMEKDTEYEAGQQSGDGQQKKICPHKLRKMEAEEDRISDEAEDLGPRQISLENIIAKYENVQTVPNPYSQFCSPYFIQEYSNEAKEYFKSPMSKHVNIKMLFLGDHNVNKSLLIRSLSPTLHFGRDRHSLRYQMIKFFIHNVPLSLYCYTYQGNSDKNTNFEIPEELLLRTDGLVIVYDLTRPETLQDAERWLDRTAYRPLVPSAGGGIIPYKFLVGTKLHLLSTLKQEQVKQLGCEVARKLGCELHIVSTISRTGINRFWSRLTALSFENAIQRSAREDRLFTRSMGVSKKVAIVKSDTLLHSTKSRVIKFNTMKSRKSLAFQDRGLFEAMQERIKQKVFWKERDVTPVNLGETDLTEFEENEEQRSSLWGTQKTTQTFITVSRIPTEGPTEQRFSFSAVNVNIEDITSQITKSVSSLDDIYPKIEEYIAEPKMSKYINIKLTETEDFLLFQRNAITVDRNGEEAETVMYDNAHYDYLTVGKGKNRRVSEAEAQTPDILYKSRSCNTDRFKLLNAGAFVSNYEMFDTFKEVDEYLASKETKAEEQLQKPVIAKYLTDDQMALEIFKSPKFKYSTMVLLRIMASNIYSEKMRRFRNMVLPDPLDLSVKYKYRCDVLWTLTSFETYGKAISSISWCHANKDLLAVAYGVYNFVSFNDRRFGCVFVWSIKNPINPEIRYRFNVPVTSVQFSGSTPQLLAVGLYDGRIEVYDISEPNQTAVAKSQRSPSSGVEPVWDISWLGDTELLSCSQDGTIMKYSIVNSPFLVGNKQMRLDRIEAIVEGLNVPRKHLPLEAYRHPQALSLIVHPIKKDVYMISTEEGTLHRCSTYYPHQHIGVSQVHDGPCLNMEFSPWSTKIFLTCGADWCIRLWIEDIFEPVMKLSNGLGPVQFATWSPLHSTIIASTTKDAVEIWDIRRNILKPVSVHTFKSGLSPLTICKFSPCGRTLVVGDAEGQVYYCALEDMPFPPHFQYLELQQSIYNGLIAHPELQRQVQNLGYLGY